MESFAEYAGRSMPKLFGTARAVCGDPALAEDLVQDVLIKLQRAWPQLAVVDQIDAYVRRMLINEFLSWRRKWARVVPHPDHFFERGSPDPTDRHAEHDALAQSIRRLPPRQRVVIGLRYYADLTDDEIAADLGCTPGTVRSHASKAITALRLVSADSLSRLDRPC